VTEAFEKILDSGGDSRMLQTDKGSEFDNSSFQQMLKRHNIHFYTSENEDIKAAVVERFNRTLKTKMYRYFTFKNTLRYIDILQDLVDSYNTTRHRSIGMSPDEVTVANEAMVRSRLCPTVFLAHAKALENSTAKYHIKRVVCKAFAIPQIYLDANYEKVFSGQLPTRIVVGLVDNRAFNGDGTRNPFNLQHFDLSENSLYLDGQQQHALKPTQPNFGNGLYVRAYNTLFAGTS